MSLSAMLRKCKKSIPCDRRTEDTQNLTGHGIPSQSRNAAACNGDASESGRVRDVDGVHPIPEGEGQRRSVCRRASTYREFKLSFSTKMYRPVALSKAETAEETVSWLEKTSETATAVGPLRVTCTAWKQVNAERIG